MPLNRNMSGILLAVVCLAMASTGHTHPGGTDADGGHWNRKTGSYHSHKAEVYEDIEERVSRVVDGDTIVMAVDGDLVKMRLADIDAPEMDQPHGLESREALRAMVDGRRVRVETTGKGRHGRRIVRLHVGGVNVNAWLVEGGHAWVYRRYSKDPSLITMEAAAKQARRGLWASRNPVAPWEWRRR